MFMPWIFDQDPLKLQRPVGAMLMDLNWHHFPMNSSKSKLELDRRFRWWLDHADAVFPVSTSTDVELRRAFPNFTAASIPVPHGAALREAPPSDPESGLIIYPASVHTHKDHLTLLKACNLLKRRGVNFHLVVTGPQTDKLGTHANPLPEAAEVNQELDAIGSQVICKGMTPLPELEALYSRASVVALPSRYEGFGLPLLEGLERGCRIVATKIAPFQEQTQRYDCEDWVSFFEPGDAEGMADCLAKELAIPWKRPPQAEIHRRMSVWTWEQVATTYVTELGKLL